MGFGSCDNAMSALSNVVIGGGDNSSGGELSGELNTESIDMVVWFRIGSGSFSFFTIEYRGIFGFIRCGVLW